MPTARRALTRCWATSTRAFIPKRNTPAYYNDPDMMVLGMPGFSDAQNRVHMSLWAISGAPLLVGADLAKLNPETLATLTNKDVLAVDQDALGLQAVKVAEPDKGVQIWSKQLSGTGTRAVLLLNRSSAPADVKVAWKDLGLSESSPATVKDLWSGKDLGSLTGRVLHAGGGGRRCAAAHQGN